MSTGRNVERVARRSSFAKRLFGGSLIVIAVLVLMEVILQLWIASPFHMVRDTELGLRGRPEASVVFSREGYFRGRLNSLGLVDSELGNDTRPRILVVGDSYTEALQVSMKQDFCSVAESLLTGTAVINGGASGRSPVQDVLAAEELVPKLKPVAVVLQVSSGDLESMFSDQQVYLARTESGAPERWKIVIPPGYLRFTRGGRLKMWLISHSALINVVWRRIELLSAGEKKRLARKWSSHAGRKAPDQEDFFENAASGMDYLVGRLARITKHPILLYIPELHYLNAAHPLKGSDRREFWVNYAHSRKLPLIDPSDALYENYLRTGEVGHGFQNSILGEGHLNSAGHRIVGEELARVLRKEILGDEILRSQGPQ